MDQKSCTETDPESKDAVTEPHTPAFPNKKQKVFALAFAGLLALIAVVLSFLPNAQQQALLAENGDKIQVVASFYPMADFTRKIGGDKVEVTTMIPVGTEPHGWEPTPSDVKKLIGAKLFVYNGLGVEPWVDSMMSSLQQDAPATVEASKGIKYLYLDHNHAHGGEAGDKDVKEGSQQAIDPHVWLDPLNALKEMENICQALCKVDPDNAQYYKDNLAHQTQLMEELNRSFAQQLESCPRHEIVVSHEAYGYLCHAYGLEQIGIEGLEPDSEPDAKRMAEIVNMVKTKGITTIFYEDLVSPKVAEEIAKETGCKAQSLSPLESLTPAQERQHQDYYSIMKENLVKLKEALS